MLYILQILSRPSVAEESWVLTATPTANRLHYDASCSL